MIFLIITIIMLIVNVITISNGGTTGESNPFITMIQVIVPILLIMFGWPIKYLIDSMSATHTPKYLRKRGYVVLNEDGSNLTSGQVFGRAIIVILIYYFGFIWVSLITILATDKKQGLQDLILRQVVIKKE